ncbi:MAG: AMP-binding protein [Colwellia sp.]|nr:AMP-binding protein [Colwellia sp.]
MPKTIIEYLRQHVAVNPDELAFSFLPSDKRSFSDITFKEFWSEALSVANFLKSKTKAGDKVLLVYPPSLEYVVTFYGCLLAGVVAVPIPLLYKDISAEELPSIVKNDQLVLALTTLNDLPTVKKFWQEQKNLVQPLDFFTTNNSVSLLGDLGDAIEVPPRTPAFLNYLSGFTGENEEVISTHEDIIESIKKLSPMSPEKADDIFVGWLPFFHDVDLAVV